jgi:hypothetical protein
LNGTVKQAAGRIRRAVLFFREARINPPALELNPMARSTFYTAFNLSGTALRYAAPVEHGDA